MHFEGQIVGVLNVVFCAVCEGDVVVGDVGDVGEVGATGQSLINKQFSFWSRIFARHLSIVQGDWDLIPVGNLEKINFFEGFTLNDSS